VNRMNTKASLGGGYRLRKFFTLSFVPVTSTSDRLSALGLISASRHVCLSCCCCASCVPAHHITSRHPVVSMLRNRKWYVPCQCTYLSRRGRRLPRLGWSRRRFDVELRRPRDGRAPIAPWTPASGRGSGLNADWVVGERQRGASGCRGPGVLRTAMRLRDGQLPLRIVHGSRQPRNRLARVCVNK
jgi:hypothetical protein